MSEGSIAAHHLDIVLKSHNGKVEDFLDDIFLFLALNTEMYFGFQHNKSTIAVVVEKFLKYEKLGEEPAEKRRKVETGNVLNSNTNEFTQQAVAPDGGPGLIEVLELRKKNMLRSHQYFPRSLSFLLDKKYPTVYSEKIPRVDTPINNDKWNIFCPPNWNYEFEIEAGIVQVYESKENQANKRRKNYEYLSRDAFVQDMKVLCSITDNPAWIVYCKQRLDNLIYVYEKYMNDFDKQELLEQGRVAKDFSSVMKVDTHVHSAGCSTMIRFLNFLEKKFLHNGNDVVYKTSEGKLLTLKEVFELENIKEEDLNLDRLNVHADTKIFNHFEGFNHKFRPFGSEILRKIFLKSNNYIQGRYFAELIKEVISDYSDKKCQAAEIRLTVYGKSVEEWSDLAKWAEKHDLHSDNVRWLIQIPRIFPTIKKEKPGHSFQDILENIFIPLFKVTSNPDIDPLLHSFLKNVVGIDAVDDESDESDFLFNKEAVTPEKWKEIKNPPYNYYIFYLYSNLALLNQFRHERGLSLLALRPHCGEAGPPHHLATAFLLAESISHGIVLRKSPVLHFLYYLSKMGIGMSLLSNHYLFLKYEDNPFLQYLHQGLNISLSTDDPLIFHITETPLQEEFSKACHSFKLTSSEMCEMARNSIKISGFDEQIKEKWVGRPYKKDKGENDTIKKSNIPKIRDALRQNNMDQELALIFK